MANFFTTIPVLETDHYVLRGMTLDDTSEVFDFKKSKEIMKFITPNPVQSESEMREEITKQLEKFSEQKEIPWIIINKSNGDLIGSFSFHKLHMFHKKAEMGVVLRKDYQGLGVMTEVLEKVLACGFDELGLNRIVGDIFAANEGSRRLLEKFGFKKEGTLRQTDFDGQQYHDTVVYSLLKSEYDAKR